MEDLTPQSLIKLHYSIPERKDKMIDYLIQCWRKPITDNKLGRSLTKLLHDNEHEAVEGPLILLLTMRNRKILQTKTENSANVLDERLTRFLKHLEAQRHDIFLPDAASVSIQSSQKYSKDIGYVKMFQIERVRRIRSASGPGNYNLSFCMKILDSIKSNLNHHQSSAYGAIHMPTNALPGLIDLQIGLCKARTASYEETLKFAKSAEENFKRLPKGTEFQELRLLLLWWTHELRERIYSQCFMIEKSLEARRDADKIVGNLEESKKDYIEKIRPDNFGILNWETLLLKICRLGKRKKQTSDAEPDDIRINDFLYAKHLLLSRYLAARENFDIKKKYEKKQIVNLIYPKYDEPKRHDQKYDIDIDDNYIYKLVKRSMNQFLLYGIVGDIKRDIGLRVEPLLFDHTTLKRHDLIRRINKHCSVTLSLIQISKERDSGFLILQLTLIGIDFLVKCQRLLQIYERRGKKRKYNLRGSSGKTEDEKFTQDNLKHLHRCMLLIFDDLRSTMLRKLPKEKQDSELLGWIKNIGSELDKIKTNDSMKYIHDVEEFCRKAVENSRDKSQNYFTKIILNFMQVTNSGIEKKEGKKVNFDASFTESDEKITPYSATPGENKFKAD